MGMDSKKLSKRSKQPGHDRSFEASEQNFFLALQRILDGLPYEVEEKPRDLAGLFEVPGPKRNFGVIPEVAITSRKTKRKLFFEVKKQGPAGNADERACKHHTTQFYSTLRDRFDYPYHPFFTVFCENLATDQRYVVKHPYFFEEGQYFCWVDYDFAALQEWILDLCRTHLED